MSHDEPTTDKELLKTIENVWAKYPELRLTQLLVNAINPSTPCPEVFYVEDSKLITLLNKLGSTKETSSDMPTVEGDEFT